MCKKMTDYDLCEIDDEEFEIIQADTISYYFNIDWNSMKWEEIKF